MRARPVTGGADTVPVMLLELAQTIVLTGIIAAVLLRLRRLRSAGSRARRAGHPCAPLRMTWRQRCQVAADIADALAAAGLPCTRQRATPVVRAASLDGEYVISVNRGDVAAAHLANDGVQPLGLFSAASTAARVVAGHAGLAHRM